ncbi:AI-2E family transporter [Sphingomonas ginkgonis]|uniref:AI-2E family transporter n=1 Tax=Sphingomonas ginkgonis TaxID=2315330 RepID=A0A3R9Z592_9SPHN|nr:AI-2E family transporter [Sphingomonas ginkgonis]RST30079.1 AI-2E family transporter [Sphingomonas ginkgonis]
MQSRSVATAQIITGIAAAIALLYYLRNIMIPLVVAFVLAVLVNALVRFIHRLSPRPPSWAVSAIAGIIVISIASGGIFAIAQGMAQMVAQGPAVLARLDALAMSAGQAFHLERPLHLTAVIGEISIPRLAGAILSELQGFGSGLLLVIVYFGFILAGRKRLGDKVHKAAGSSERARMVENTIEKIVADIETYVWVQTITGAILTAAAVIVMAAVGLHNVLFWGVVFFLLTFIPNIGVTVGSVFPSLFALVQFPTIWQSVVIFAVIQVVATIVGNLIYPRMQAETQNIDPVATLLSLSFWSVLWGLPGAFLAVPMTLMLMMVFGQFEATTWVSALLSNDGEPNIRKNPGERPKAIRAPD